MSVHSEKKKVLLSILLIILAGFAVYASSIDGDFIYDDHKLVRGNVYIKNPAHIAKIFTENTGAGGGGEFSSYRPVQLLTYMLDYRFWRLNVRGYHLSNIVLHVVMTLTIYWFIYILFGNPVLSLVTGILFVVHPVHTEAVSYISGRADLLSGVFMMLCIIFYVKELERHKGAVFALMLLSYILALLSRENSIILPVLLLLYHLCFKKNIRSTLFLPIMAITAVYALLRLTVFRFREMLSVSHISSSVFERIMGFFVALTNYARLLVWPVDLHMEYGKVNGLFPARFPQAVLGIVLACILFIYVARKKNMFLTFCILWFFVALVPVSNIFPVNAYMAEHWLYVPSIGIFLLLAQGLILLYERRNAKVLSVIIVIVMCCSFSYATIKQNHYWSGPEVFYERTLEYSPDNIRMINNLAKIYHDHGETENAIIMMKRSIALKPRDARGYNNLGSFYRDLGRNQEAIGMLKKALSIDPDQKEIHNNLGLAYASVGRHQEAVESYKRAIAIRLDYAKAHNNLANTYSDLGRYDEAVAAYKKAIQIDPDFAQAYYNLSLVYFRNQQIESSIEYFDKARTLNYYDPAFANVLEPYR